MSVQGSLLECISPPSDTPAVSTPRPAMAGVSAGRSRARGTKPVGAKGACRSIDRQSKGLRSRSTSSARGRAKPEATSASAGGSKEEEEVLRKLSQAEAGARKVEEQLEDMEGVDRRERRRRARGGVARVAKMAALGLVAGVLCVYFDVFPPLAKHVTSLALAGAIAFRGLSKGSLSPSGSLTALFVGWATFSSCFAFGVVLIGFFFSSSALTKLKQDEKAKVEKDFKKDGQRDHLQVLANGGAPTVLALAHWAAGPSHPLSPLVAGAFLGYYACCCGDTWSSEVGVLSPSDPILITTLRRVRRGTNGGVSAWGLLASLAGGGFVGACFLAATALSVGRTAAVATVPVCAAAGLLGSLVDSLLGATLQVRLGTSKLACLSQPPC